MIRVDNPRDEANVAQVYEANQEQVFQYWNDLDAVERRSLLDQIASIDFPEFRRLVESKRADSPAGETPGTRLAPAAMIPLPRTAEEREARDRAHAAGMEALNAGEVGVFLVAGGQGTRLGFEGPKGCFPLLPISGATLFQHFAEKIRALRDRTGRPLPWFIMTSQGNDATTREFFRANGHFGLPAAEVHFQPQAMLPVVDPEHGRILMTSPSSLMLSPNGHGGAVRVMQEQRAHFERYGTRHLFYHQVDNPLVAMADPVFLGHHILNDSGFSSKAVAKTDPAEKVGLFCVDGGTTRVVEYSEISDEDANLRDPDGGLTHRAGNIAVHVIATDFVAPDDSAEPFVMPYHIARKAVRHLRDGELVGGSEPNSVRYESFIFDLLPRSRNPVVLEADRALEFAPVKNAEGSDSPSTSRAAMAALWAEWLDRGGVTVPRDDEKRPLHPIEISPLVADDAETLAAHLAETDIDASGMIHLR